MQSVQTFRRRCVAGALIVSAAVMPAGGPTALAQQSVPTAAVRITTIPPRGAGDKRMETIRGAASGFDPASQRIVIFSKTNVWWVQPYVAAPYTGLKQDGSFATEIHLGYRYAALLVDKSFVAQPTMADLPALGNGVVAMTIVEAAE
jgi:hypothetical protein